MHTIQKVLNALVQGLVQGITEFLPISSSGHITLLEIFFGFKIPLTHIVLLHLASLFAIVLYNRKLLARLIRSLTNINPRSQRDTQAHAFIIMLAIATASTALIAIPLQTIAEDPPLLIVIFSFATTGILLFVTHIYDRLRHPYPTQSDALHKHNYECRAPHPLQALVIGLAQGLAVLPGISRSGCTIAVALLLGLQKSTAFQFSFILAIPAIIASFLFTVGDIPATVDSALDYVYIVIAIISAFFVSLASLTLLKNMLYSKLLWIFGVYLFALSGLLWILFT